MAHDLIPPSSPAGKPQPENAFSSTALREQVDSELEHAIEDDQVDALPESSFRGRFGLITGALAGIGIAGLAVLVILLGRDPGQEPKWSQWQPDSDDPAIQLLEIGRYVSYAYRDDNGDQLNKVDGQPFEDGGSAGRVVLRSAAKGEGASIEEIDGDTVLFTLKGLGPEGSIDTGEASIERLRLLQREATELALYALKYVKGTENVVAILPPPPPTAAEEAAAAKAEADGTPPPQRPPLRAMLYRPGDLEQALKTPLDTTFPDDPPRPATMSQVEAQAYQVLAEEHLFEAALTTDQLDGIVMVLDRVPASQAVEELIKPDDEA